MQVNAEATKHGIFRFTLGAYLCVYFLKLIPWAPTLLARDGLYTASRGATSLRSPLNIIPHIELLSSIELYLGVLALLSLGLALGTSRRLLALCLWLGFVSIIHRNIYISNVATQYIGWLLLYCALLPAGEGLRLNKAPDAQWALPDLLRYGAWAIFAFGYTLSGYAKLQNAHWLQGSAVEAILNSPLASDHGLTQLIAGQPWLTYPLTWITLAVELGCALLCLHKHTRMLAWIILTGVHLGILLTMSIEEISIVMLIFHMVLFDPEWVTER